MIFAKKIGYISERICTPIQYLNKGIGCYENYIRCFKDDDSEQTNISEMISNIEKKIFERRSLKKGGKNNCLKMFYFNKLVVNVRGELDGRYRTFM